MPARYEMAAPRCRSLRLQAGAVAAGLGGCLEDRKCARAGVDSELPGISRAMGRRSGCTRLSNRNGVAN